MGAEAVGAMMHQQFRLATVGNIINAETAIFIAVLQIVRQRRQIALLDMKFGGEFGIGRRALELVSQLRARGRDLLALAQEMSVVHLDIDNHDLAHHPHLVGVGGTIGKHDGSDELGIFRIGNIYDAGAVRWFHVADKGVIAVDHDLPAADQVEPTNPF